MGSSEVRGHKRRRTSDYACQYRVLDSPVHRLGGGWKLALGSALSVSALLAREPGELGALLAVTLCYYFAARLSLFDLWRDIRFLMLQSAVVFVLYAVHFGVREGSWPALRTSLQMLLAFMPGMILLRTTKATALMRGLRRLLPYQISFLISTSLRFVPFFAKEAREIAQAQKLRGACLAPRQLRHPRNWTDLLDCLLLPLMVRALKTAEEASLSAQARGFGSGKERTYWDPEALELDGEEGIGEPAVAVAQGSGGR